MPGSGTQTFTDSEAYEAGLRQWQINSVITCHGAFKARLTWVELDRLHLLRCREAHPRIAYLSLPPAMACAAFRTDPGPAPFWGGMELHSEDIMFHGRGARLHQRTTGPCLWNLIALTVEDLKDFGWTLFGKMLVPPVAPMALRPSRHEYACVQRLHAAACRLAETNPRTLLHRQAVRSLEQDLILALVTCLIVEAAHADQAAKRHHARIMIRFEEILAEHLHRPLRRAELCELIGVTDQTLRSCCTEFLGIP